MSYEGFLQEPIQAILRGKWGYILDKWPLKYRISKRLSYQALALSITPTANPQVTLMSLNWGRRLENLARTFTGRKNSLCTERPSGLGILPSSKEMAIIRASPLLLSFFPLSLACHRQSAHFCSKSPFFRLCCHATL